MKLIALKILLILFSIFLLVKLNSIDEEYLTISQNNLKNNFIIDINELQLNWSAEESKLTIISKEIDTYCDFENKDKFKIILNNNYIECQGTQFIIEKYFVKIKNSEFIEINNQLKKQGIKFKFNSINQYKINYFIINFLILIIIVSLIFNLLLPIMLKANLKILIFIILISLFLINYPNKVYRGEINYNQIGKNSKDNSNTFNFDKFPKKINNFKLNIYLNFNSKNNINLMGRNKEKLILINNKSITFLDNDKELFKSRITKCYDVCSIQILIQNNKIEVLSSNYTIAISKNAPLKYNNKLKVLTYNSKPSDKDFSITAVVESINTKYDNKEVFLLFMNFGIFLYFLLIVYFRARPKEYYDKNK